MQEWTSDTPARGRIRVLGVSVAALILMVAGLVLASPVSANEGLTCHGLPVTISSANSHINGTDGPDVILGLSNAGQTIAGQGGNDVICAGAGADRISGGTGNDRIFAGGGNDWLTGGDGNDVVWGEGGDDTIYGRGGDDLLFGGAGDDTIDGNRGDDVLRGHAGDDKLSGGSGNDVIGGSHGNDVLAGGPDADDLDGGADSDALVGVEFTDSFAGGAGVDQCTNLYAWGPCSTSQAEVVCGSLGVVGGVWSTGCANPTGGSPWLLWSWLNAVFGYPS